MIRTAGLVQIVDFIVSLWPLVSGLVLGLAVPATAWAFGQLIGTFLGRRRKRLASDESFRKLDAKKHNEHIKLIGSFCNTLGAAILGAAFIVPYIGQRVGSEQVDLRWVGAGLALPLAGHFALRFMKSEG